MSIYSVKKGGVRLSREDFMQSKPPSTANTATRWRPDVYVHSFIPEAFTAINKCPSIPVITKPVEGIDFPKYVHALYGQRFLRALPIPQTLKWNDSISADQPLQLDAPGYGQYFQGCMTLDNLAQEHEIRSFDIFGAKLTLLDRAKLIFTVKVPGLREDAPSVKFGDSVFLRQWVEKTVRPLELGMYGWLPASNSCPGFTGYENNAVIVGVDRITSTLHIQAYGILDSPQIRCNIIFARQAHLTQSVQLAVFDVANELQKTANDAKREVLHGKYPVSSFDATNLQPNGHNRPFSSTNWLRNMLFPTEEFGIIQEGLTSINFPQKWVDLALNYEQKKAVNAVTTENYGQLCYLINGPAGTGKTKTICEMVTQLGRNSNLQGCILLCAPSNQAADTLTIRLKSFQPTEMLRLNHFSRTFAEVPMDLMMYCAIEDNTFSIPPIDTLMRYKIVITTCQDADLLIQARVSNRDLYYLHRDMTSTLFPSQSPSPRCPPLHWSALIIDEAAQATEPDTLIPLTVVVPPIDAPVEVVPPIFVMAGDQHQLGPRTYDQNTKLHISLFERLSNEPVYAEHPLARSKIRYSKKAAKMLCPPFANLMRNYRSHPAMLAVPSSLFYSNTLVPEATSLQISADWHKWSHRKSGWPVHFFCNGGSDECESIQDSTHGWYNRSEALKAVGCAQQMMKTFRITQQDEICIMSPFRGQVRHLRKIARERNLHGLNIGPVESFQGLEKRIVIFCTTRARLRFLTDDQVRGAGVIGEPKKFNVAITRAKEGLVVIGNPWVLGTDPCWLAFLKFCWRNDLYWKESISDKSMHGEPNVNDWAPEGTKEAGSGVDKGGLESALLFKEKMQLEGSNGRGRLFGHDEDEQWRSGVEAEEALGALDELTLGPEDGQEDGEEV